MIRSLINTILLIIALYLYIDPRIETGEFTALGYERGNTIMLWMICYNLMVHSWLRRKEGKND